MLLQIKAVFDELGLKILSWPGNSPDLNPIENIWRLVGLKVNRLHPKNEKKNYRRPSFMPGIMS